MSHFNLNSTFLHSVEFSYISKIVRNRFKLKLKVKKTQQPSNQVNDLCKETLCTEGHLKHAHNPIKETLCMEDHLKHAHNPIKETLCMEDHLKHAHNLIKETL